MCDKKPGTEPYGEENLDTEENNFSRRSFLKKRALRKDHAERKKSLTSPIPSAIASENDNRIWMIGSNNVITFLSPSQNSLKTSAWVRKRFETASGSSQPSSFLANG